MRASPQQDAPISSFKFGWAQVPSWAEAVLIDGGLERTAAAGRHRQVPAEAHAGRADGSSVQHGGPAKLLAEKIRLLQEPEARLENRLLLTSF